jgi:peptide/nickel transport system permease protein
MIGYIIRRVLVSIPIFLGITVIVYALYAFSPGDPLVNILGVDTVSRMTAEQVEQVREQYGFNDPWYVRYANWLGNALRGDLGYPLKGKGTVVDNLAERIPPTLLLMGTAFTLALLISVPMGMIMALKQYSWIDYVLTIIAFANLSIPVFFLGLGCIYVFSLKLDIMPTYGMQTIGAPSSLGDRIHHLIMPATILAVYYAGMWARYTRSSMLEVMRADYVTVARAKGLKERVVVMRHIFRNTLLTLVTVVGFSLPQLLGGAIIIETIFQWPGMGMLAYRATTTRDYPILMGVLLVSASAILISNLLADIGYALVDPRVCYD